MAKDNYKFIVRNEGQRLFGKIWLLFGILPFLTLSVSGQTTDPAPFCNVGDECGSSFEPSITNVTIGNSVNNSTGCNNEGSVTYFNNLAPAPVSKGQTITGSVTVESYSFNDHGVGIWVDLNGDGSFSSNEMVYSDNQSGGTSVHNFSFQIPSSADANCVTRMRVKADENVTPASNEYCQMSYTFGDGEVEDYDLLIQSSNPNPNIAVEEIISPKTGKSSYGIEKLKVAYRNVSANTISANTTIPFQMITKNLTSPESYSYTTTSDIASCEVDTAVLGLMSLGCPGVNDITVWGKWNADVNRSNDTVSSTFGTFFTLASENFESGNLPSDWTEVNNTISVEPGGPGNSSHYLNFDPSGNATVDWDVNIQKQNNKPVRLVYNIQDFDESEWYTSGIYVSNDNGSSFDKILDWDDPNVPANGWIKHNYGLDSLLADKGLGYDSEDIDVIRFLFDDSIEELGLDNVRVVQPKEDAQPASKPSQILSAPDTVYVNSPTDFATVGDQKSQAWYRDGKLVDSLSKSYTATFTELGKDSISVIAAGCYGIFQDKGYFEVVNPPKAPVANFIANKNVVDTNGVVSFSDESRIGPTSWEWEVSPRFINGDSSYSFVNGTGYSSSKPDIRFHKSGTYDITLIVGNQQGYDTLKRKAYIDVKPGYRICRSGYSSSSEGRLYDPAGTGNFNDDSSQYCTFVINPDCADSVSLSIESLNIAGEACNVGGVKDYIEVYDGMTTNGTPLHAQKGYPNGIYSGNAPSQYDHFTATSGAMVVAFNTNGCASSEDFVLNWEAHQSADGNTRQAVSANHIQAPDTAYIGGFTHFGVTNHIAGNTYKWVLPNGVTNKFDHPGNDVRIDKGIQPGMNKIRLITENCGFADTASAQVYFKKANRRPVANFMASRTNFKVGDTIQLQDLSERGVTSWKWEFPGSSAIEFVKGSNAQSRNPYITVTATGSYRVDQIVSNNVGQRVEAKIDYLTVQQSCQPVVNNTNPDLAINRVAFYEPGEGMIYENVSGLSSDGYSQYNAQNELQLEAGKEYVVEIGRNSAFNNWSYGIWVDLNNDGEFTTSERLTSNLNDSGYAVKDTISIPDSGIEGALDMRFATNGANSTLSGCGPNFYGEFEDYSFEFLGDATAPMLTLKGNDTLHVNTCDNVTDTGATAFDIVDGNLTGQIETANAEVINEPGTHQLIYQVSDVSGNMSQISQTIIVGPDTSRPQITLDGGSTVDVHFGGEYEEPGYTAMDTCGDVKEVTVTGQVNTDIVGDYTLTYTAIDYNGNESSVKRTVNVYDSIPPEARLNGRDTIRVNVFSTFDDPGVIAGDNYHDSTWVHISGQVDTDEIGTYNQVYNVIDADSNVTQVERVVIVEDNEAPTFSNLPEEVIKHDVRTKFNYEFAVSDNYYDANSLSVSKSGSFFNNFPNGVPDSVGFFNARFTYEDGSGNTNTATIGVQVVDREAPTITLLGPSAVNIKRWEEYRDSMDVTYEVNDNHYSDDQLTVKMKGSYFNQYIDGGKTTGFFEKRYQVVDPSGNESDVKSRGINVMSNTSGVEDAENLSLNVYPNPTQGEVNLDIQLDRSQSVDIDILNMQGQVVENVATGSSLKEDHYNLDLSDLGAGVYQVRIQTADKVINRSLNIVK